ncbi:MAG TPA: N-acetyl-gamma-glutamyl-phosphate reductase [Armatimonadota bacterium]|jgi:N-acetyl-gamma-glutamyl-phosphate reductase
MSKSRVAIVGATGYGASEILRLLMGHDGVEVSLLTSESSRGKRISQVLPRFRGVCDRELVPFSLEAVVSAADVVFLAMHAGKALEVAPQLLAAGKKVIDLSADFRLKDPAVYEQWYGLPHSCPELLPRAVYGLPELHREAIRGADLVALPGCYPTSVLLATAPLLKRGLADPVSVHATCMSGVSGAGRSKLGIDYHFPEVDENLKAYGLMGHRHRPEMEQELSLLAGTPATMLFVAHLVPVIRGILSTVTVSLTDQVSQEKLQALYEDHYGSEPFVHVMEPGEHPETRNVQGTNACHLSVTAEPRTGRAILLAAEDNLGKGIAGQALQCMNLMLGLPETTGLRLAAVGL